MNLNVNRGLGVIMVRPCGFVDASECNTVPGDGSSWGACVCEGSGAPAGTFRLISL